MTVAICIASGPSLTQEDVDYCRGKGTVYVINDSHRMAPWADVLYACDGAWWDYHWPVPFAGEMWTLDVHAAGKYKINLIGTTEDPWSTNPDCIAKGGNSGFQTLNLAILRGATKVILLGYDLKITRGKTHWFGDHPNPLNRGSDYTRWLKYWRRAAPMIKAEVINCSPDSALDCFPKRELRHVL